MGVIKLSNEINDEILEKLYGNNKIDNNIKDFINEALKIEYSEVMDIEKKPSRKQPSFKKKYLKLIDDFMK